MSLLILLSMLLGRPLQKSLRHRRFKSDRDEIWQQCSSSKCASNDVRFLIWRHTFKMAAMTAARQSPESVWRQFLSRTFVLVSNKMVCLYSLYVCIRVSLNWHDTDYWTCVNIYTVFYGALWGHGPRTLHTYGSVDHSALKSELSSRFVLNNSGMAHVWH